MATRALALLAVLASCGGEPPLRVLNLSSAPWAVEEVVTFAGECARWWGGDPDDLDGWKVVLSDDYVPCDVHRVSGCADPRARELRVRVPRGWCIQNTALRHEVGHVILRGDGTHAHPAWRVVDLYVPCSPET